MKSRRSTKHIIEPWEMTKVLLSQMGRWTPPGLGPKSSDRYETGQARCGFWEWDKGERAQE